MNKSPKFSPEVRERAVRMVQEHRADYPSLWVPEEAERLQASVRSKVEHPFRMIKQQFGYAKERYRGLGKNTLRPGVPSWHYKG